MTDRHAAYIVTLESDVHADDAEAVINALRMVRGVADVEPVPANVDQHIAATRARTELEERIYRALGAALRGD